MGLTRELLRLFGPDQVAPELAAFRARLRGNEALARSHVYDLAVQGASLRASCPALGAAASSLEVPPAPPQTLPEAGGGQTIGRPPHEGSACLGQAGDAMEAAGPVEGPAPAAAAPAFAALGSVVAAIAARNPLALAAAHLDNAAHLLPSVRSRLGPDDVEVLCQTWRKCGVNGVGRGGGGIDAHHAAELLAHLCHAARTPCPDDVRRNASPNGRTAAEQRLLQAQEVLDAWTQHSAHPLGACPCRRQMGPISTAVWLLGAQLDLLALHVELQAGTVEPEDAQMRLCQTRCAAQDLHDAACARGTGGVGEARHARYGSASLAWAVLDFMQTVGPDQWPAWLPLISALTTALGRADDHPDVATQMHRWLTEVLPTCLDASGCVKGRTSGR